MTITAAVGSGHVRSIRSLRDIHEYELVINAVGQLPDCSPIELVEFIEFIWL